MGRSRTSVVSEYAPWRRGIAWWMVLVQGLVLAALGGAALWRTELANTIILVGLGVYLVLAAVWTIVQAMRGRDYGLSVFNLLAAGGGFVAGLGVLMPFVLTSRPAFDPANEAIVRLTSFITFGVALVAVGLLWLLSAFIERPDRGLVAVTLVRGIFFLGLGGYILFGVVTDSGDLVRWIALAAIVLGVLLVLYSLVLYRRRATV
jgi:uncharacterized membrane protein HdeD (DUF308 family)